MTGSGRKRSADEQNLAGAGKPSKGVKRIKKATRAAVVAAAAAIAAPAAASQLSIDCLPSSALQTILVHCGYPHRFTAAQGTPLLAMRVSRPSCGLYATSSASTFRST